MTHTPENPPENPPENLMVRDGGKGGSDLVGVKAHEGSLEIFTHGVIPAVKRRVSASFHINSRDPVKRAALSLTLFCLGDDTKERFPIS